MNEREIFKEILSSDKMKQVLGVNLGETINEDYDSQSAHKEINVVHTIIDGKVRHISEDGIFKSLLKLFDL